MAINCVDALACLHKEGFNNYWAKRIISELLYLQKYSAIKSNAYKEDIDKAVITLYEAFKAEGAITKDVAEAAEKSLLHISPEIKNYRIMLTGHAHIDMNWMWGYHETAALAIDTFRTVLNLMKEYPNFTFSQSQASTYKIVEEFDPEMLEEIKQRIREGRWEVTASTWVENDKNMPNGEAMARHILYTKRYLSKLLDIPEDSLTLDFEPDTFGHNANIPEILSKGGIKYYYFCRAYDGPHMFRWRSPSGAEILAYRDFGWVNDIIQYDTFTYAPEYFEQYKIDCILKPFGIGDHGGGPTRRDIEMLTDMASWPLLPALEFGSFKKYFAELEHYKDNFPVVDQELNFIFTGCYTSQSRIKAANRMCEARLYESEVLSTAASVAADAPVRSASFDKAWKIALFNQFHDILPGSGTRDTREYAMGQCQQALTYAGINSNNALRALANAIDTSAIQTDDDNLTIAEGGGVGFGSGESDVSMGNGRYPFPQTERGRGRVRIFTIFNTTSFDRDCVTEITVWDYTGDWSRVVIKDADGKLCPYKILTQDKFYWFHNFTKIALKVKVPAFGYSTYVLSEITDTVLNPQVPYGKWNCDYFDNEDYILENDKIKAVFDSRSLRLVELTDKSTGVKPVCGTPSCFFRYIKESDKEGMTSWRVGRYMQIQDLNDTCNVKLEETNFDSIKKWIKYRVYFASSNISVTISLYDGSSLLDFDVTADWQEIGHAGDFIPQLNFCVPVDYACDKYRYDIPFGVIDRDNISHDVPANSFMAALNGGGKPLMIVADSKYGFRGCDNSMAVSLIRSSFDPDIYPEFGVHTMRLGVALCKSAKSIDMLREATAFCHPLYFVSNTRHSGKYTLDGQLLSVSEGLVVSAVKLPEDGGKGKVIVRLYNPGAAAIGRMTFAFPVKESFITDISERKTNGKVNASGKDVTFPVAGKEQITLQVIFQ